MRIADLDPRQPGAIFSEDRRYRYALTRPVGGELVVPLFSGPPGELFATPTTPPPGLLELKHRTCAFLMVNPSKAGERENDQTIRKCISYVRAWGYWRLVVVNLFAWCATDVGELADQVDPVGPKNDAFILEAITGAGLVVAAWGAREKVPKRWRGRESDVVRMATTHVDLHTLMRLKGDAPSHPLMLSGSLPPLLWRARGSTL